MNHDDVPTVDRAFPGILSQGMTLRDYFAAAALTGLLSGADDFGPNGPCARAYQLADRMLAEREKQ